MAISPSEAAPELTVVMPVFNARPYFDAAVASILEQTWQDFRLAIYDDHSTDGSYEAALAWAERDPRISVVRGDKRLGPSLSSNAAAALAETDLVARMDADDIAAPGRLAAQIAVLRERPDAVLVGSTFDMIDAEGRQIRPPTPGRILGRAPPFAHPSIMYRRRDFEAVGGYQADSDYFEDLDLYLRMAKRGPLLVINTPLLRARFAGQHARLHDSREVVLRKIDRLYRDNQDDAGPRSRISIMAFYSVAVLSILALERPHMLGDILRRGSLAHPLRALKVIGIVALAELSPRLARLVGHGISAMREYLAPCRLQAGAVLEWSPKV